MKESIGIEVNDIVSRHVDLYLAEAQTESYPYAVYTNSVTPVYTKDGIHHYEATIVITICTLDLDEADEIADNIVADMERYLPEGYYARLESSYPDCVEGIWTRVLTWNIKQYK